jgi:hypothetical protein
MAMHFVSLRTGLGLGQVWRLTQHSAASAQIKRLVPDNAMSQKVKGFGHPAIATTTSKGRGEGIAERLRNVWGFAQNEAGYLPPYYNTVNGCRRTITTVYITLNDGYQGSRPNGSCQIFQKSFSIVLLRCWHRVLLALVF